jgi:hypothetical protein
MYFILSTNATIIRGILVESPDQGQLNRHFFSNGAQSLVELGRPRLTHINGFVIHLNLTHFARDSQSEFRS